MHENEFEKQVQKKMEELQFAPSEAVWQHVDKEINKKEKRRRPVFWLFFFLGLMLLGGGYYFMANKKNSTIALNAPDKKTNTDQNKLQNGQATREEKKIKEKGEEKENDVLKEPTAIQREKTDSHKTIEAIEGNSNKKQKVSDAVELNSKRKLSINKEKASAHVKNVRPKSDQQANFTTEKNKNESETKNPEEKETIDETVSKRNEDAQKQNQQIDKTPIADTSASKKEMLVNNKNIAKKDSVIGNTAKNKVQQKKSSSWKIGYTGSAGSSSIYQSIFKSAYSVNPSYSNTAAGPTAYYYGASKIRSGFSFSAGAFLKKNLSKRVSFSAGLSYHYYSTKISTGQYVDSSKSLNNSPSLTVVQGYYSYGSNYTYTNHFHFIELPVSLNFQLNKSEKHPLIWEGGFSISYLAGTNALHFAPYSGVYYKDNGQFNKMQFNAATSLMLGFRFHKNELQLGPQLQYGLTGLLKKSTGDPEHLFYAGMKFSFIPQKK